MANRALIGVAVILLFSFSSDTSLQAQSRQRKGYLAFNAGPNLLPGEYFGANAGLQMGLEFGYDFSHGLGIAATWLGAAFQYESTVYWFDGTTTQAIPANYRAGYAFLGLGPLYSIRASRNMSIDFKGRVGRFYYEEVTRTTTFHSVSQNTSFGYFISASCQQRMTEWWTFFGSLDYGHGRKPLTTDTFQPVNSLALTIGVGVRL